MNKNNNKFKEKEKIIEKCIDLSFQINDNLSKSSHSIKSNIFKQLKNYFKYNISKTLSNKFIENKVSSIIVFYKKYNINEKVDLDYYHKKINKLILMTYRSNYKMQINIKNKKIYTSDCGWGCTIRSSQMIFSRIIYKIFKYYFKNKYNSETIIKSIIPFFLDNNINYSEIANKINNYNIIGFENYINQIEIFSEKKIDNNDNILYVKSIDPPFSIHKICIIGEIFGRTCGEWFSDYELPKIYEIINSTFNILPNLSILHFTSEIKMNLIMENCFEKIESAKDTDDIFLDKKNKKYKFKKMGAIFVSIRLGVESIPSEYFLSINQLFSSKQFLGFIGGKTNSAFYFFGLADDKNLLYLDPHINQESIFDLEDKNISTYLDKTIYSLKIKNLQCAFTIGFLFRNIQEFRELYVFLKVFNQEKFPCFHVLFDEQNKNNLSQEEIKNNINNEEEDF